MKGLNCIMILLASAALTCAKGWGDGERADFAGAPNLVLNPGFESDGGGAIVGKGTETRFSAKGDGIPDEWQCKDAVMDTEIARSGRSSVRLSAPEGSLTSTNSVIAGSTVTTFLPGGMPVLLSAWSRAENVPEGSTYRVSCAIGGKAYTLDFTTGTHEWENKSLVIVPEADFALPSVSITFQAPEGSGAKAWFDDVYLGQMQPYPNLAVNAGFEQAGDGMPHGWEKLPADYLPYWGGYYWPAVQDNLMSHRGSASMRCDASLDQIGGAAQTIFLRQKEARAIIVGAYCRAENLINDNFCWLAAETWYTDGKRELETARVWLGKGGHEWDYRTFTIVPKRPVERIVVKVENRPSVRTTSVWVDDLYVVEVGSVPEELRARGLNLPLEVDCLALDGATSPETPDRWDEVWTQGAQVKVGENRAVLAHDDDSLYVALSAVSRRVEVMLAPLGIPGVDSIDHISFYRFSVSRDGKTAAEAAIDQDGYVFYLPADLAPPGWQADLKDVGDGSWSALIRIPFAAIGMNYPAAGEAWGLNLAAHSGKLTTQPLAWAGTYEDYRSFGTLSFSGKRELELTGVSLGEGLPDGLDMSETWITRGVVRWGENILRARLRNTSLSLKTLAVQLEPSSPASSSDKGTTLTASIEPGKAWDLGLPYRVASSGRQQLRLTLKDANSRETIADATYPINIPEPIQIQQDELYYYPDETRALFDIACPGLSASEGDSLRLKVLSESTGQTVIEKELPVAERQATELDISALSVSSEPVREYRCLVELVQGGKPQVTGSVTFGRMERPHFPPQPPVEKVEIGPDGALHINGKPFFLIAASLRDDGPYARASAMGFNAEKTNVYAEEAAKARIDEAWSRNTYFLVSHFGADDKTRENVARYAATQPGVIMHVGSEVDFGGFTGAYNWKKSRDLAEWDPNHPVFWEYQGGAGHWYWRVLGHEPLGPISQLAVLPQGGPVGRLVPRTFDLERAAHIGPRFMYGAVVPWREDRAEDLEPGGWHQYMRSFPWISLQQLRANCYLAIINGSRGIYYYDPGAENQIDEARGLAVELRLLSPIILSPEALRTVSLLPARNHVDVMQREYEGKTYLITCNRAEEVQQVEFRLPNLTADTPIIRRFEPLRPIERTAAGKGFKDTYGPYEVHIYEIG